MYVMTCLRGRENRRSDASTFYCKCGRASVVDHAMRYSEEELVVLLATLKTRRDELGMAFGIRNQAV